MFSDCLISHTAFPSEAPHPPPSASEFNNTGTVVGVIFAVVVMAILAVVLVIIMKRRQDKRRTLYRSKCSTASCFSFAVYLLSLEATYEKSTIVYLNTNHFWSQRPKRPDLIILLCCHQNKKAGYPPTFLKRLSV